MITVCVVSFVLAAALTYALARPGSPIRILDQPNERSLHTRPTPRTGGLAIVAAIYGSVAVVVLSTGVVAPAVLWLGAAGGLLAVIAFGDDLLGLAPIIRLVAQLAVAGVLIGGGFRLHSIGFPAGELFLPGMVGIVVTILFIVWMTNLYNFMDGIDGVAGGMAVIGFATLAWFGWIGGNQAFVVCGLAVVAAALGFLVFNFPPARIFMGDVGSSVLGLFAAGMTIWGAEERLFPFWAALLVFSPFIADATVTLGRRLFKKERVWLPHKTHYYQRLVQLGWGHRRTLLCECALMLGCSVSAIWAATGSVRVQWAVIVGWVLVYGGLACWVARKEVRPNT